MELYNEHLNSILIPDSERQYYLNIVESYRRLTEQLEKTKGVWTAKRIKKIQQILKEELLLMNKEYREAISKDIERIINADLEAYTFDKEAALIAAGTTPELFGVSKSKIKQLSKGDDFLFSYIRANGDVVKNSISLKSMLGSIPDSAYKKANAIFLAGATVGDSPDQIARSLRPFLTTQQKKDVRTVTRTLIGEAVAKARYEWDSENLDIIDHWEYVATLDSRTSSICRTLDGKTWKERPPEYYTPKLHPNCRSILVSVPAGYPRGQRPINLMTAQDKKTARKLKGEEKEAFYKSKIVMRDSSYTYKDAVKEFPQLNNKKFINLDEYEKKIKAT